MNHQDLYPNIKRLGLKVQTFVGPSISFHAVAAADLEKILSQPDITLRILSEEDRKTIADIADIAKIGDAIAKKMGWLP